MGDKTGRGSSYQRIRYAFGLMESALVFHVHKPDQAVELIEQAVTQLVKARNQLVDEPIAAAGPVPAEGRHAQLALERSWFPAGRRSA